MKVTTYLLVFLILGLTSCDNSNEVEPAFVFAKLNGVDWTGNPEITLDSENDTLTFLGVGDENVFGFKLKFRGEGAYDLSNLIGFYYTSVGGDVITSSYLLDLDKTAQVTITQYDSQQNSLQGSFEISYLKNWSNPENNINSIIFTEGKFEGTIGR